MKFLFILFLFPLKIFAQDITGVWSGTLYNDTTKESIRYELAISEYNGKLSGYSHTIFIIDSVENVGVKSVKIKRSGDDFLVEDDKLIDNNYTAPPAKGVKTFSDLVLSQDDSAMFLQGPFKTNQTKIYKKLTGKIFLQKKKEIEKTLIIPKLQNLGLTETLSFPVPKTQPKELSALNRSTLNSIQTSKVNRPAVEEEKSLEKESAETSISKENNLRKSQLQESLSVKRINDSSKIKATDIVTSKPENRQTEKQLQTNRKGIALNEEAMPGKPATDNEKDISTKQAKETTSYSSTQMPGMHSVSIKNTDSILKKENSLSLNTIKPFIPQAAANIADRKIETIKSVEIRQDSLVLSLFDNGEIDGDTVSVLLNGKVIMPRQGLMSRAINKTIYLTPEMGDSIVLIMYAENLGSIPPNTGLLVIHDGEDIFEIRFAGDLQKNSAIILRRKKGQ